jgi:hypothetical protein
MEAQKSLVNPTAETYFLANARYIKGIAEANKSENPSEQVA